MTSSGVRQDDSPDSALLAASTVSSDEDTPIALSVVIVTYNEEAAVERCLESVFRACRDVPGFEVILVDSNSTDGTVARALEFPITIFRISDDDLTTPSAGRYVGTKHARGERILFVDGDMCISESWLSDALARLGGDVVAVDGHLNTPAADDQIRDVDAVRGVALYDAAALREVGGFDPTLRALEDIELGYRLTAAGYRLCRLPSVAATHFYEDKLSEPFRRWRFGYYFGFGQVLRKSTSRPRIFIKFLRRGCYTLGMLGWLAVGLATVLFPTAFVLWVASSVVLFVAVVSQLGVHRATIFWLANLLGAVGLVVSLVHPDLRDDEFSFDVVERLQTASIHSSTALDQASSHVTDQNE